VKQILDTIKLLRLPYSIFLLPISLFSFYYIHPALDYRLALVVLIWHLLVFPSSNAYNSYHDRDEGPIGALAAPPKPTRMLLQVANVMDIAAVLLSFLLDFYFAAFVAVFIITSRLYSNRKIRFKRLPVTAFLIVCLCQGAGIFCANIFGLASPALFANPSVVYAAIACSLFIATLYPLTQIYQHEADSRDGVKTISILFGKRGTFIFSGVMFALAALFVFLAFSRENAVGNFWLFNVVMLPAAIYFVTWAVRSFRNPTQVNFRNTMIMLVMSSVLNNVFFVVLLLGRS
jgi:1,4-dihydroxy-2-naphthoate octaprenyltransferase